MPTVIDGSGNVNSVQISLASQAQAEAGTDNATLMTPLLIRNALRAIGSAPIYACRAWVNFNGNTGAVSASGNISSVTRTATGTYTINFSTAMIDALYVVAGVAGATSASGGGGAVRITDDATPAAGSVSIQTINPATGAAKDSLYMTVAIFR